MVVFENVKERSKSERKKVEKKQRENESWWSDLLNACWREVDVNGENPYVLCHFVLTASKCEQSK